MKTTIIFFLSFISFCIQAQNKVGINTATPEHELEIKSMSTADDADFKLSTPDGTRFLKLYSGNNINKRPMLLINRSDTFRISNSEPDSSIFRNRLTLIPNGYLGINNDTPGHEIDAMGSNINDAAELNVRTTDNATFLRLNSGRISDPLPKIIWKEGTDLGLGIDLFGFTERFKFKGDGKFGIGSPNPDQALDVNGKIEIGDDALPPTQGTVRFNSSTNDFEGYNGSEWVSMTKQNTFYGNLSLQENASFENPNGGTADYFGSAVAIDGNTAVVGSHSFDNGGNTNQGTAFVYEKVGIVWEQVAVLSASDGAANHNFGQEVGIDGDDVFVAANGNASVYVFEKPGGGWVNMTETAKLTPSDAITGTWFGFDMDVKDETVAVCARLQTGGGRVYIYEKPGGGWVNMTETAKLTDSSGNSSFGWDVGISSNGAAVGANSNKVFVFEKPGGGWVSMTETAELSPSETANGFGNEVDIHNNDIVVGASGYDSGSIMNLGKAYVYSKPSGGWVNMTETAQLYASDAGTGSRFGKAVSIRSNVILIGAANHNSDAGRAYIFERPASGWTNMNQNFVLSPSDVETGSQFGINVNVSETSLVIGADQKTVSGNTLSGKVYFFDR